MEQNIIRFQHKKLSDDFIAPKSRPVSDPLIQFSHEYSARVDTHTYVTEQHISSIREAMELLNRCTSFDETGRTHIINVLLKREKPIHSKPSDFLILAKRLLELEDTENTLCVCDYVLERMGCLNCDCFSIAIYACIKGWSLDRGLQYIVLAEECKKDHSMKWSGELFSAVIDYHLVLILENPRGVDISREINTSYRLVKQFQKEYPLDEAGYLREAELYLYQYDKKGAITCLTSCVHNMRPDSEDYERTLFCPLCCAKLLELLEHTDCYILIQKTAIKGYRFALTKNDRALQEYFRQCFERAKRAENMDLEQLKHKSSEDKDRYLLTYYTERKNWNE